jgi:hypothetical protein
VISPRAQIFMCPFQTPRPRGSARSCNRMRFGLLGGGAPRGLLLLSRGEHHGGASYLADIPDH